MNIVFLLVGLFIGFGLHFLYTNLKKKKQSVVNGSGGQGDPKPSNDNQTT